MRVGIFITCRLKSDRLPGKALEMIGDKRLIDWLITRCKQVPAVDEIVMMTSQLVEDDPLIDVAEEHAIPWFRGFPEDVLMRIRNCARAHNIDLVVSVTGDDPFKSIAYMAYGLLTFCEGKDMDFLTMEGLPLGCESYLITRKCLEDVCRVKSETDTEIWGHIVRNHMKGKRGNIMPPVKGRPHYRVTVDEPADLAAMRELIKYLPAEFDVKEICDILDAHPEIIALNAGVHQREAGE